MSIARETFFCSVFLFVFAPCYIYFHRNITQTLLYMGEKFIIACKNFTGQPTKLSKFIGLLLKPYNTLCQIKRNSKIVKEQSFWSRALEKKKKN